MTVQVVQNKTLQQRKEVGGIATQYEIQCLTIALRNIIKAPVRQLVPLKRYGRMFVVFFLPHGQGSTPAALDPVVVVPLAQMSPEFYRRAERLFDMLVNWQSTGSYDRQKQLGLEMGNAAFALVSYVQNHPGDLTANEVEFFTHYTSLAISAPFDGTEPIPRHGLGPVQLYLPD